MPRTFKATGRRKSTADRRKCKDRLKHPKYFSHLKKKLESDSWSKLSGVTYEFEGKEKPDRRSYYPPKVRVEGQQRVLNLKGGRTVRIIDADKRGPPGERRRGKERRGGGERRKKE